MVIRREIIKHKIKDILDNLDIIKENLPESFEDFKKLGLIKDGIYKKVEFIIENVIDICSIINSDLNIGIPSSEEDIINNLTSKKILRKKLAGKIKEMKGFRNILVHRYGKIDDEIAFESIQQGLKDFHLFIEEIEKFLSKGA